MATIPIRPYSTASTPEHPHLHHPISQQDATAYYLARSKAVIARGEQAQSAAALKQASEAEKAARAHNAVSATSAASLAATAQESRGRQISDVYSGGSGKVGICGLEDPHLSDRAQLSSLSSKAAYLAARDRSAASPSRRYVDRTEISPVGRIVAARTGGVREKTPERQNDRGAMLAAYKAIDRRKRAESAPPAPEERDLSYAVNAATKVQSMRGGIQPEVEDEPRGVWDANKVHNVALANAQRDLHGGMPSDIFMEEQRKQRIIHNAAVNVAQRIVERSPNATPVGHLSRGGLPMIDEGRTLSQTNLNRRATQLARQRIEEMDDKERAFREYYEPGIPPKPQRHSSLMRRSSVASAEPEDVDKERSWKIQTQMTELQRRVAKLDDQKRRQDQAELLARAQSNAFNSIHNIDHEIYENTGRASQALVDEWAEQAKNLDEDAKDNVFVPIGGGKYISKEEVENIARARLKPEMGEIAEQELSAEAMEVEAHLDEEHRRHWEELDREREADLKREELRAKKPEKTKRHSRSSKRSSKVSSTLEDGTETDEVPAEERRRSSLFRRQSRKSRGKARTGEKKEDEEFTSARQSPVRDEVGQPRDSEPSHSAPQEHNADDERLSQHFQRGRTGAPATGDSPTQQEATTTEQTQQAEPPSTLRQWSTSNASGQGTRAREADQQARSESEPKEKEKEKARHRWSLRDIFSGRSSSAGRGRRSPGSFEVPSHRTSGYEPVSPGSAPTPSVGTQAVNAARPSTTVGRDSRFQEAL